MIGPQKRHRLQLMVVLFLCFYANQVNSSRVTQFPTHERCSRQSLSGDGSPSFKYELLRRRIETNIKEMWSFATAEGKMSRESKNLLKEHKNSLLSDMDNMRQCDGHDEWRTRETKELSEIIQNRIKRLQNPRDCSSARKLACQMDPRCGFGCKVHHLGICLLMSYATNRTMVFESDSNEIYGLISWDSLVLPFSETCIGAEGETHGNWTEHFLDPMDPVQVLHVPKTSNIIPIPGYLVSRSIPADLSRRLIAVHGDPGAWWIGQFMKYILRFQPLIQDMLDRRMEEIKMSSDPIVGVHIRRTDKLLGEAEYHGLEEYMSEVEDYFDRLEIGRPGKKLRRRVYIASDDPSVLKNAENKYPNYEVFGDKEVAKTARLETRNTTEGLSGIILDTYIMPRCDFLVCTFSSNVCRLAYELKIAYQNLWSGHPVVSVDMEHYLIWPNQIYRQALVKHKARNGHVSGLVPGDMVKDASDYSMWSKGVINGYNKASRKNGMFPAFKLTELVGVGGFPNYSDNLD